jgi:uroporphyrinogen-III decarboxylase
VTENQWKNLIDVINGTKVDPLPIGFIIDSPWLPDWAGISVLDYYSSEELWFQSNMKAVKEFPNVIFLPGFWPEFGMSTEPSAFGTKCTWNESSLATPHKILSSYSDIDKLKKPNPATDGLLPFALKRTEHYAERIRKEGHDIKFAISRGPLNIASFLLGTTEFLMGIKMRPLKMHELLGIVTEFIIDWVDAQRKSIPSIDGMLILDDIIGFLGEEDFCEFAKPYLERICSSQNVSIKFLHNDSEGLICAPYLEKIGFNFFNFSHNHSLSEMKSRVGENVSLLGNLPPRDVLANGSPSDVRVRVNEMLASVSDHSRLVLSCGGGIPPGVSSENICAFCDAAKGDQAVFGSLGVPNVQTLSKI